MPKFDYLFFETPCIYTEVVINIFLSRKLNNFNAGIEHMSQIYFTEVPQSYNRTITIAAYSINLFSIPREPRNFEFCTKISTLGTSIHRATSMHASMAAAKGVDDIVLPVQDSHETALQCRCQCHYPIRYPRKSCQKNQGRKIGIEFPLFYL